MELQFAMPKGSAPKKVEASNTLFDKPFNEALIHQVITAQMAGRRSGTKAQKTRAEVRGGGAKPWRQKGTGRARAGTIRSPLWRGGGKVFAAKTRDFSQKVNKKMYQGALRSILSELVRLDRLRVIEELNIETPKTKQLLKYLQSLGYSEALIVTADWDANLFLSARNLMNVEIDLVSELDIMNLVRFERVLITEAALRQFEEVLG